jgi:3-hydroxyacyl-[acyl-carrier-protein] dehydratase
MKLKDDFFKILNISISPDKTEYSVRLNSEHSIYQDHFPGNPITPGVCIIQIVKELIAENLEYPLCLQKIVKVRFFKAINPVDNAAINISLTISKKERIYSVSATVFVDDTVFSQLSLEFA